MTEDREKLIAKFQQWLDTNPNERLIAYQCATIAEEYANEQITKLNKPDVSNNEVAVCQHGYYHVEELPVVICTDCGEILGRQTDC